MIKFNTNTNNNNENTDLLITNKLKTYNTSLTFYNKFNFDIWTSICILLIVIYIVIYYFILNNLQSVDWEKNKCNPFYMPFASIINSESSEFTQDNYKECLNKSNFKLGVDISKPFDMVFNIFKLIFSGLSSTISIIIRFIMYFLMKIVKIFKSILARFYKIFDEFNSIFIRISDMVNHILSIFTYIYYLCAKAMELIKFVFVLIQLSFFGMVILPLSIGSSILTLLIISFYILAWVTPPIPFIGGLLSLFFSTLASLFSGSFILSIVALTIGFILHATLNTNGTPFGVGERFKNLNDIEYDYEDKETIIKEKIKYIVLDSRQKILAGNFKNININPDNLFFKDNKVLPKCCEYNPSYSTDKGCVCSTVEQEEYLKRNGLNKSYNNNNNNEHDIYDDDNERNININNLFFSPTRAFKREESVFNDVTNKDKNKYINKNDVFHSDLSKNIVYSKLHLQSR